MATRKVIVFGPTGAVGSSAALTASELGAQVVLAMRDTAKPIPNLSAEQEKQGAFERIFADLTKPDTVCDAVKTTGAKYAFFYFTRSADNMRSTVEALKEAGIELVVFLSSYTIQGELKDVQPSEIIPYMHAQVEITLGEVFGENGFVAARPGWFASNMGRYKKEIQEGKVQLYMPDTQVDGIVPADIGRVCGSVLAKGPVHGERKLYLYGPQVLSMRETVEALGKAIGKTPEIEVLDEPGAWKLMTEGHGLPEHFAKYMMSRMEKGGTGPKGSQVYGYPLMEGDLSNVEKYSGRKATTFVEWVEQNKHNFAT